MQNTGERGGAHIDVVHQVAEAPPHVVDGGQQRGGQQVVPLVAAVHLHIAMHCSSRSTGWLTGLHQLKWPMGMTQENMNMNSTYQLMHDGQHDATSSCLAHDQACSSSRNAIGMQH